MQLWEQVEKFMQDCCLHVWCWVWIWHTQMGWQSGKKTWQMKCRRTWTNKRPGRCTATSICLSRPPTSLMWMTCTKKLVCFAIDLHVYMVIQDLEKLRRKCNGNHRSFGPRYNPHPQSELADQWQPIKLLQCLVP